MPLDRARARLGAVELPGHDGPLVAEALRGSVRGTRPLGLFSGLPWCAAFVGLCLFDGDAARALAWRPTAFLGGQDPSPVGWRASVAELVVDARATGTLRAKDAGWQPGDLVIFGRSGQSPLLGGLGHVAFLDEVGEGGVWLVGGDVFGPGGYGVRRTWLAEGGVGGDGTAAEPVVGWIAVAAHAEEVQTP